MLDCVVEQAREFFITDISIGAGLDEATVDSRGADGHVRVGDDPGQRAGELIWLVDVEDEAGAAIVDPVSIGANSTDDREEAAGQRFEER